jgi:hypothetical protein
MEVVTVHSQSRTEVSQVFRLLDGQRRRLVVHAPYGYSLGAVFMAVLPQLTAEEATALGRAYGLDVSSGPAPTA